MLIVLSPTTRSLFPIDECSCFSGIVQALICLRESAVDRSGYLVPEIRYLGIDYNVWTGEVNCFFAMSGGGADGNPAINCGFTMERESLRLPKQVRYFCGGLGRVLVIKSSFFRSDVNKIKVRIIGGKQVWQGRDENHSRQKPWDETAEPQDAGFPADNRPS